MGRKAAGKVRIPVCAPLMTGRELHYLRTCIESSWISASGPLVPEFERKFAKFSHAKYGVSTNSGTTALHLALAALRIGPGDEVILPSFTMIACPNSVTYTGAKVVLVDSDEEIQTIDAAKIEEKVTPRTKAIMPVHIYGHPADMDPILEIAKKRNLYVVEDAAEAQGSLYKGRHAGSLGDIGSFSFYSNKVITTGEGGMNISSDKKLSERMAWLRGHAFGVGGRHFWHEELGFGYRMSALQAAVGLAQFESIRDMIKRRIAHARLYNELLAGVEELILPIQKAWARNVYWMYSVRVKNPKHRDRLIRQLAKNGIEARTFFYPIHMQPFYARNYEGERYPVADRLSATGLNLPSGNGLSDKEIQEVCGAVKTYFAEN